MKKNSQAGFTLIELVIVIVLLGILAATAIPKYFDLKVDAINANTQGIAAGISVASLTNYGKSVGNGAVVQHCSDALWALDQSSAVFGAYAIQDMATQPTNSPAYGPSPTGSGTLVCQLVYTGNAANASSYQAAPAAGTAYTQNTSGGNSFPVAANGTSGGYQVAQFVIFLRNAY